MAVRRNEPTDWRAVHHGIRADLIAQGMTADSADDGAIWLTFARVQAETGCDLYDADATLRQAGIEHPRQAVRWSTTRGGDYLTPGTTPSAPVPGPPQRGSEHHAEVRAGLEAELAREIAR